MMGQANITVSYHGQLQGLRMLVIHGDRPSLLGRDWLYKLCVIAEKLAVYHTRSRISLESVLAKHMDLF